MFQGKDVKIEEAIFLVKMRASMWIKAVKESDDFSEALWWNNPGEGGTAKSSKGLRTITDWKPPLAGALKFNVDGFARGKPGPAGCGGVLRDADGKVLALFSCPVESCDANVAELWGIWWAFDIFLNSNRFEGKELMIESDSAVALAWCSKKDARPWKLWKILNAIDCMSDKCKEVKWVKIFREANGMANCLAKSGVDRRENFIAWW